MCENLKIKLDDFRKRIKEGIFWNYRINYLTEFDLYTGIV